MTLATLRHRLHPTRTRHHTPHYECLNDTPDRCEEGADEPGVGHCCACDCPACTLHIGGQDVCVCPGCDARVCGLHVTEGSRTE